MVCTMFQAVLRTYSLKPVSLSSFQKIISVKFASSACVPEDVGLEEMKKLVQQNTSLLIDVREPGELQETGAIPNSINIPLGEIEQSFRDLSQEAFKKKFGKKKPSIDCPIVVSCKAGIRSGKAQSLMQLQGFKNVRNFMGGWIEWSEQFPTKK